MFRILPFICALSLLTPSFAEEGFTDLFNGTDLTGWSGDPQLWSVQDGAITGVTRGEGHLPYNKFLIWSGGTVSDFELRLKFRLEGENNSGVQYRSQHLTDEGEWVAGGYQADIHPRPEYTGMLYDERGRGILARRGEKVVVRRNGKKRTTRLQAPVQPLDLRDWHELTIIARGERLVHQINGVTVVDVTDRQKSENDRQGILALQVHRGPAMKAQFKEIRLKNLSKSKPSAASTQPAATQPAATSAESLRVAEGFHVELLYSVPGNEQGSWVSMCVDPQGRLITCDQNGGMYRVTLGAPGLQPVQVEPIDVDLGGAQGLLWAFDSLYVVVNGKKFTNGVYRVRDTDGDDRLDDVELLRELIGSGGEHGPHAVLPAPDGKSLYIVCGNQTKLTEFDRYRVPPVWDEDLLLPRTYGRGFMRGTPAPGGYISRIDPDGKTWELVAVGFRNEYDAAVNADGELFTYDADMEWDINAPWYRPTRVCHVVSGAEFGWRNGSGKWPVYYHDSLPPVLNIGPGSPTGVGFGYGARFPKKYQKALFICDWSYGTMYATHLEPNGSSYTATAQEFITGTPLPLTDLVVNPLDGAMYFTIGGRGVQSGLYRVTYRGKEDTSPAELRSASGKSQRELRRRLESLHGGDHPQALEMAWPHLNHSDRFVRYAARIAIEHQPVDQWRTRALEERDPQASLTGLLALVRQFERSDKTTVPDLDTPPPVWEQPPAKQPRGYVRLRKDVVAALERLDWQKLSTDQKLQLLRVYTVTFTRLGRPAAATRQRLIAQLKNYLPADDPRLNSELAQLSVYLQAPWAAEAIVKLLEDAPTQEQQIDYAKSLRHLRARWNRNLRQRYFKWFNRAAHYRGGASFTLFVDSIKADAVDKLTQDEKLALEPILDAPASHASLAAALGGESRPFVKKWTRDELLALLSGGIEGRNFRNGRKMFAAAKCFACHRFNNQGGALGPDLTGLSGRFSTRDIVESIVEPSKVISDQYAAVQILTRDGRVVTGRIVNLHGDSWKINTDMLDPNGNVTVKRGQIEEMVPSQLSMMPTGLLDTLNEAEILDLMAYLLSRGDANHPVFN